MSYDLSLNSPVTEQEDESNWAGCADTCARLHKEIEKLRALLREAAPLVSAFTQSESDLLKRIAEALND